MILKKFSSLAVLKILNTVSLKSKKISNQIKVKVDEFPAEAKVRVRKASFIGKNYYLDFFFILFLLHFFLFIADSGIN